MGAISLKAAVSLSQLEASGGCFHNNVLIQTADQVERLLPRFSRETLSTERQKPVPDRYGQQMEALV